MDRFAIRTLCYRVIDGQLHFAARADELAALPPMAAIDPQAIFDYLYFHVIPSPRTIFQGVHRLPPAHYALFEDGQLYRGALLDARASTNRHSADFDAACSRVPRSCCATRWPRNSTAASPPAF